MKKLSVLLLLVFLIACEKDIDIDLDQTTEKIVVDATIENGVAPRVILSRSLEYFSKIDPAKLASSFVRNAKIVISDGTKSHQLAEDSLTTAQGTRIYYYTINPLEPQTAIFGQLNGSYTMNITVDGKEYSATTSIPDTTRRIDSIWWEPVPVFEPEDSNLAKIIIRATDRPGFGDYIRYFTRSNSEGFLPGLNSVFDDQVIDGTTYTFPVDKGVNKNDERKEGEAFFNRGDTVTIKVSNIDKVTYDFWRTFEFSYQSVGNPFSNPTKILSNIKGDALGYFGGYASQYRFILIPPR
jgi:hypothetical protein